jgi:MFS family permease
VRSYVLGVALGTLFFAGFTSIFLVLTLYLQTGLQYSALEAGFTQTSFAIGSAVAAALGGRFVHQFGRVIVVAGLLVCALGLVWLDVTVSSISDVNGWMLAPSLLVAGFGTGLVISPNVTISLSEVDPRYAGSGGGMLQTAQRVGSAIGVALVLAQFFSKLASSHDVAAAFTLGLRTTTGFVVAALLIGLADLFGSRRRTASQSEGRSEARQPEAVGSD